MDKEFLDELESFDGCKLDDKFCLIESFFGKVPLSEVDKYRRLLIDENFEKIMEDEQMVACVNEFFNHNLNITETSKKSFLHRNTLLYRLEKIYKLTGLNLKKFNEAVTFKILMLIYKSTR